MGYSYGRNRRGNLVLACDACGKTGGVRRRTCPHRVLMSARAGSRDWTRWCKPPALCRACFVAKGATAGLHAECEGQAARAQASEDADQTRLDTGDRFLMMAIAPSVHNRVRAGRVELVFLPAGGSVNGETRILVPEADFDPMKVWLSDYPDPVWSLTVPPRGA